MAKNTAEKGAKTARKRGRPRKAAPTPETRRKQYNADTKTEAKDLYQRGVSLERIGRYLAVPLRTLTNWQTEGDWTIDRNPGQRAAELRQRGYSMADIAARLEVSERTVRNWLKALEMEANS